MRLINNLIDAYNSYERPAKIDNAILKVEFIVTLRSIIDVVSIAELACGDVYPIVCFEEPGIDHRKGVLVILKKSGAI